MWRGDWGHRVLLPGNIQLILAWLQTNTSQNNEFPSHVAGGTLCTHVVKVGVTWPSSTASSRTPAGWPWCMLC